MTSLAIGIASGMGNGVYLLPAIKALKLMGNRITLFVQTDFRTRELWDRCVFADEVLEPPANGWVKVRHRDGQEGYARVAHLWGV